MAFLYVKPLIAASCALVFSGLVGAAGMRPETPVVLVNAADGEGTINVTNTDAHVALLHTSVVNLPEDTEELLLVTSPINRVEAGEKQLVRLVLHSEKPLLTQRMKRVIFEGIAPQSADGKGQVTVTVRQDLPVIISPADLPANREPWKLLKWEIKDQTLTVRNDSRYVVRLNQELELKPAGGQVSLPRAYLLPGQFETIALPAEFRPGVESAVRVSPITLYGSEGELYNAPLLKP